MSSSVRFSGLLRNVRACDFMRPSQYTVTACYARSYLCTYSEEQMEAFFSVEEAARRLGGISKWTIHAWLERASCAAPRSVSAP